MIGLFRRLAGRPRGHAPHPVPEGSDWPAPRPEGPVYVIGDLHGRRDLMDRLLERIEEHARGRDAPHRIVLVGDYVDRGPDAAGVLARARALAPEPGGRHAALYGNHEAMMLEFLADPTGRGLRWLRFGGRETLRSFGVDAPDAEADLERIDDASAALSEALGPLAPWLRALPGLWRSGDLAVVHAGADPGATLEGQPRGALAWGHAAFLRRERADGIWVAHGHIVMERAYASGGRIGVDTGAVYGGALTAAAILPGAPVAFLSVG